MKRLTVSSFLLLIATIMFAQYTLKFNVPYTSSYIRSEILPSDRIPSDFLGCTLGVTSEIDALKNFNRLGIQCTPGSGGASDVLTIDGDIECEGIKFMGVSFWFYNNIFWKIVFINMKTDSSILANTIRNKYSKFPCYKDKYEYIRYKGSDVDLVHNQYNLQYTIRGGSCTRFEE